MMGPIYEREGYTGIFPNHMFRGVVKISLSQWTKTYTVSDMKNAGHIFFLIVS